MVEKKKYLKNDYRKFSKFEEKHKHTDPRQSRNSKEKKHK